MARVDRSYKYPVLPNDDKRSFEHEEQWSSKYDPQDPYSFFALPTCKALLIARPNSGKSNLIKNLIMFAKPQYTFIYICHHTLKTREYDDINMSENVVMSTELPTDEDFPLEDEEGKEQRNLCILDDVYTRRLSKDDEKKLNKLFTYVSSHCNTTVLMSCHDYVTVPVSIRRSVDIVFLWKIIDQQSQQLLTKKFGLSKTGLYDLFKNKDLIPSKYSFLTVDFLPNTPAKFRIDNMYPIDLNNLDEDDDLELLKVKIGKN